LVRCEIEDGEHVSDERRSALFKTLQVVRFFDRQRNVLVYVAYSDRIIEGSPKNTISSVPIRRLAGTVVVQPVSVGNFVTEQATQGQDVCHPAAGTRHQRGLSGSEALPKWDCIEARQRKRAKEHRFLPARPFSRPNPCAYRRQGGGCEPVARRGTGENGLAVEGTGFEPSVPP
jgi:hypothetical protein